MKPLFFALLGVAILTAVGQTSPQLSVQKTSSQSLRIAWTNAASGFALEQSSSLDPASWEGVPVPPAAQNGEFTVLFNPAASQQFFRLHSLGFTRIADSSPLDGETGVAVTRETIVRFTAPLARSTILTGTNFYAGFGGRRLLTRIELSSDRTRASLFYLEPMPGSTRITAVFDGTGLLDDAGQPLDLDDNGLPGGFTTVSFETLNTTALNGTAVIGRVFASELMPGTGSGTNGINRPLEGVTITVDGREQELRATTDAEGNFTLSPAPPGRFFVHIDGRTVRDDAHGIHYPDKSYYPFVGKAWEALAGKTNNFAGGTGEIFLPLIIAGTLQPVSPTEDTTISFPPAVLAANPALDGVFITVPANSLFNDNGTRGGEVGIAPVAPDRLPGPLPQGADLPLVITVQTDGALNFDTPAPACFPNLPNSTTGKPWPPGTKGSLISFNHKKGIWEDVGGMTVSEDGRFFCTDPGVGIRQPGWHGPQCPKPKDPPPPPPNPPDPPCKPDPVALAACFEACSIAANDCLTIARLINDRNIQAAEAIRFVYGNKKADALLKDNAKIYKARILECIKNRLVCDASCIQCSGTPKPKSPFGIEAKALEKVTAAAGGPGAIESAIWQDLDSINALLDPYLDTDLDLPPGVVAQIRALLAHANTLAGGDGAQFLEDRLRDFERANNRPQASNRGNAPAYPVFYAAEINRSAEIIVFRGKTEPFGQYLIFAPPDGDLVHVSFYDPRTKQFGDINPNFRPEAPYALPRFTLYPLDPAAPDSDGDGLPDAVEFVYGTDPHKADTDGDGIPDGAEIDAGTDPLGGLIVQTGIIATAKTPGSAVDVSAGSDLVVTAEGSSGISIFKAYNGDNPVVIAHVPTPGTAQRVAVSGNFVAVAQPDFGLSIIDVSTPANAAIVGQFPLSGAQAVVLAGETIYVGAAGAIAAINLTTGLVNPVRLTNTVRDLAVEGDYLYALLDDHVQAFSIANGTLSPAGSAPSPIFFQPNLRLFVGGTIAYAVHNVGYNTLDLSDPAQPALIKAASTGSGALFGWKQIVSNGSGRGLAAVGPNSAFDFAQDVSLYDLSSPTNINVPITIFPTPGHAQAVAIWKGLGYVADLEAGLQVINYLPYDNKGIAPQIALVPHFDTNGIPAASHVSVGAHATDDVQVRAVEFYVNGVKVFTDGNFPFEYRFAVPALTTTNTNFTLQARAVDTGGNATWSETITVRILPDLAEDLAPVVKYTTPAGGGGRTITNLLAYFSKALDPATLNSNSFRLFSAGADGTLGTADDLLFIDGSVGYRKFGNAAAVTFGAPLPIGHYRAVLSPEIADPNGHHLAATYSWDFQVADASFWVNLGDGPWDIPSNWDGNKVPTGSDNAIINAPVTVTLKNTVTLGKTVTGVAGSELYIPYSTTAIFDGLTLNMDLLLDPNVTVRVTHGLTLNGVVTMPGGQNYSHLNFDGTQTLDGKGQIILTGPYSSIIRPMEGTLTIGPELTIRGTGIVGDPSLPLVNLGTLVADGSTPGSTLTVTGSSSENRGKLRSVNNGHLTAENLVNHGVVDLSGGSIDLTGTIKTEGIGMFTGPGPINIVGTLDNRNGVLKLDETSPSWQLGGGTLLGGVVSTSGGAQLTVGYSGGILDKATINGDLHLVSGTFLRVRNGLTLNGTASLETGPNGVGLNFDGSQTFDGTGQVLLPLGGDFTVVRAINGVLTIGPEITIRGSGVVGNSTLPLVNQGAIVPENGRTIHIFGSGVTNTGTFQANGATIAVDNLANQGQISSAGGTITLNKTWSNDGSIDVTNATLNLGGTFTTAEIGVINASNAALNITGLLDNRNSSLTLQTPGWQLTTGTILGGTINALAGIALNAVGRSSPTLDGVVLDVDLVFIAGAYVRVTNGLTLNRTATLNGSEEGTTLNFDGPQTLDGSGQLIFVGFPSTLVQPISGALTIGPGVTARGGSGTIGNKSYPLTVQGTIIADGPTSIIKLFGNPLDTPGAIRELNGGQILLGP